MREASERLHQRMDKGLLTYHQKGHISAVATRDAAIEAVAAAYLQGLQDHPDRSHIALSATRAGVSSLNHAIRRGLLKEQRLGTYVSETILAFGRDLRVKDRIVLTQNATRMWVAEGQTVTDERDLGRINNGDRGTIQAIHVFPDNRVVCEVTLDRGGVALIDSALYKNIEYGYAVTVHKSQGITIDHAYIYLNKAFRKALAYVAFTRHRYGMTAVYARDEFKDYGALEAQLLKESYDRMTVDYSLSDGEQQIADKFYQYQELIRTMALYYQRVKDAVGDRGVGRALSRDSEYQALMRERSTRALNLTDDWGDVHTRLCNLTGIRKEQLYKAAGIRTAHERDRDSTVTGYMERFHRLRKEAEDLRTEMGAIPYGWDDPIVQRLQSLYIDADHLAEQLLSYRDYRRHIERAGISWKQLEHQAARLGYRHQRSRYYLELSEDNRAKAREVSAFAKESQLLRWQYEAMVTTHSDITRHIAYDGYAVRQQALNATAATFVDTLEQVEHMLIKEGINPIDLHTRASCHRIHLMASAHSQLDPASRWSIHSVCLGIAHEIDLDPALRSLTLQVQLGLTLPQELQPKTVSPRTPPRDSTVTQTVSSSTQAQDIPSLCKQMRETWDRYESVKMSSTLGTQAIIHAKALKDAQRARDQAAAHLTTATSDRRLTPYSEKQWAAIHGFASTHTRTEATRYSQGRSVDELTQTLKDQMPQLCEALLSERPSQQRVLEWRYGAKGSLKVTVAGAKAGSFVNFETGERGNVLQFIATHRQCDRAAAIEWARQFVGESQESQMRPKKMNTMNPLNTAAMRTPHPDSISVEHLARWSSQIPPQDNAVPNMTSPALKKMYWKHTETARYTYTDATGHPLFYVVRFEPKTLEPLNPSPDKRFKMTLPLSYGVEVGDTAPPDWRFKKYIAPNGSKTPLYNLQELHERPQVPILVVEGEKAADAAKQMFPEMVVTTWQGGASAVHLSDWTSLKDREIIIWPDNDSAGLKAAEQIKERCEYAGAKDAAIVNLEFDSDHAALPPKWDLADALPQGLTVEDIRQKVATTLSTLNTLSSKVSRGLGWNKAPSTSPPTKTTSWDFELGD